MIPPLFSYYGGKHATAGRYPPPDHDTIIEPFAGSAGYSHRYWRRRVILVERDPIVAAVWRYLIAATPDDIMGLPLLTPDDDLREMQLADAERWLVGFWVGKGRMSPGCTVSSWARDHAGSVVHHWGEKCRARLAANVSKVNHWTIIEGDYTDAPDIEATWFIDPPYQAAGKHYRHGSGGIDYAALGAWCRARRGQVMVCENDGADWLPFSPIYQMAGAKKDGDGRKISTEAVWVQGCSGMLFDVWGDP